MTQKNRSQQELIAGQLLVEGREVREHGGEEEKLREHVICCESNQHKQCGYRPQNQGETIPKFIAIICVNVALTGSQHTFYL